MINIDTLLHKLSSDSKANMKTSHTLDQRILELSKTGKRNSFQRANRNPIRWVPLVAMFVFFVSLPFFTNGKSDGINEKDCIQFYSQLTKAINEKDLESLLSAYGCDTSAEDRKMIQTRIEDLFNSYSTLEIEPSAVTVSYAKQEALLKSTYRLVAGKSDGSRESVTGTDRLYMKKTAEGMRLCLWITE